MVVFKKAHFVLLVCILSLAMPAQANVFLPACFQKKVGSFFSMVCSSVSDHLVGATEERITLAINQAKKDIETYIDTVKQPLEDNLNSLAKQAEDLATILKKQEDLLGGIILTNDIAKNLSAQVNGISEKFQLLQESMQKHVCIVGALGVLLNNK